MLSLLAFVVVAVALATPFVVPLMWGQLENPESASWSLPVNLGPPLRHAFTRHHACRKKSSVQPSC
jgi:hypothetical protein